MKKTYYHIIEQWGNEYGHQGFYLSLEDAKKRASELQEMFPKAFFYVEASNSKREPNFITL